MQIVCPNCSTPYQVADAAIGEKGRTVRCARCQKRWFATAPMVVTAAAPADAPAPAAAMAAAEAGAPVNVPNALVAPDGPASSEALATQPDAEAATAGTPDIPVCEAPREQAPVALSDIPIPVEDAPPLVPAEGENGPLASSGAEHANGPEDIESVAARKAGAKGRKRRSRLRIPLPVILIALLATSAALISWRKEVVRHAPQMASFYEAIRLPVNVRGLAFTDLKIATETHDGVPVLMVEGTIVSMVSKPVDVPRLRFALRNAAGAEVYAWTAPPSQPVLEPFESLPFRSRLASPPAEGQDIQVRFFTPRDAVAGAR